jgi:hypothetical protein
MAAVTEFGCPRCGQQLRMRSAAGPCKVRCGRCGHVFATGQEVDSTAGLLALIDRVREQRELDHRQDAGVSSLTFRPAVAVTTQLPHRADMTRHVSAPVAAPMVVRALQFVCASRKRRFECFYGFDAARQLWRLGHMDGTGDVQHFSFNDGPQVRRVAEQVVAATRFDVNDFDWSDWRCAKCSAPGFNHDSACDTNFCQSQMRASDCWAVCPHCQSGGYYTSETHTLRGEQITAVDRPQQISTNHHAGPSDRTPTVADRSPVSTAQRSHAIVDRLRLATGRD